VQFDARSIYIYNVANDSNGAADDLRDRYLRLRQVRRARERQGAPLLHELREGLGARVPELGVGTQLLRG
jgi:hypothetical protein